jgi:ABC-type antimicrobial peptide transport system permease subunit
MPAFGIPVRIGRATARDLWDRRRELASYGPVGSVSGILGSMALSRLLDGVLYGSRAADPLIVLAVGCGFVVLAVTTASGPARRASRSDPMHAVRAE